MSQLLIISDLHGNPAPLHRRLIAAPSPSVGLTKPDPITGLVKTTGPGTLVIQLGDHSFGPEVDTHHFHEPWDPGVPVHVLHGNHDYEPALLGLTEPTPLYPHLIFLPDSTIIEHHGRRIGILGGADSVIDRKWRKDNIDWWPEEAVTQADVDLLVKRGPVDILLTHTAPAFLIRKDCGYEPSASEELVEQAWRALGKPLLFCGHIHYAYQRDNIHVLPFAGAKQVNLETLDHQDV